MGVGRRKYVRACSGDRGDVESSGMEEVPQGERVEEVWVAGLKGQEPL